ncbi:MAG: protein kinase [Victivallales bacterium]|nr:protein kinase [Victivallales bacterium]
MAGIVFKCPHCEHSIASDDSLCGELAVCPECQAEVVVPIPGLEKDSVYGDFKLLERLGSGASGEVWLAHQQSMDRKVALKVLCPKLSSDKSFTERFMKEAKNSAKLSHPNIVTAFYAGLDKGMYYLAISYVNGDTIASRLEKDEVYDEKDALKIIRAIASALQYAWEEFQIIHRDIKPANIIIDKKGTPMLLDLGISKSTKEDSSLTMTGTVVGTPYYMSPEQAIADKDMDFRSDIYSLGTTLYHMLTGNVPYYATTAMAIIMKHINDSFESPRMRNPKITTQCTKLIEIMMAKKKVERQQSWQTLLKDIDLVLAGKDPATPVPGHGSTVQKQNSMAKDAKAMMKTPDQALPKTKSTGLKIIAIAAALLIIAGIPLAAGLACYMIFFAPKKSEDSTRHVPAQPPQTLVESRILETPTPSMPTGSTEPPDETASRQPTVESAHGTQTTGTTVTPRVIPPAPPDPLENAFREFADNLDLTKNTKLSVQEHWKKVRGQEISFVGKLVNVKGGWGKAELHVACPNRMIHKGFNAILVTPDRDTASNLKLGENIRFKGNVYNYKPYSTGLVMLYINNVVFLEPETN